MENYKKLLLSLSNDIRKSEGEKQVLLIMQFNDICYRITGISNIMDCHNYLIDVKNFNI